MGADAGDDKQLGICSGDGDIVDIRAMDLPAILILGEAVR